MTVGVVLIVLGASCLGLSDLGGLGGVLRGLAVVGGGGFVLQVLPAVGPHRPFGLGPGVRAGPAS